MHETPDNVVANFFGRAKLNKGVDNLDLPGLPGLKHHNPAYHTEADQPPTDEEHAAALKGIQH